MSSNVKRYKEISKEIEAVQYDGTNWEEIDQFVGEQGIYDCGSIIYEKLFLKRRVDEGDFVYKYLSSKNITRCLSRRQFLDAFERDHRRPIVKMNILDKSRTVYGPPVTKKLYSVGDFIRHDRKHREVIMLKIIEIEEVKINEEYNIITEVPE